jgi:hypothetical protein
MFKVALPGAEERSVDPGGGKVAVLISEEFGSADRSALEAQDVLAAHDPGFEFILAVLDDLSALEREELRVKGAVVHDDLVTLERVSPRGYVHGNPQFQIARPWASLFVRGKNEFKTTLSSFRPRKLNSRLHSGRW